MKYLLQEYADGHVEVYESIGCPDGIIRWHPVGRTFTSIKAAREYVFTILRVDARVVYMEVISDDHLQFELDKN